MKTVHVAAVSATFALCFLCIGRIAPAAPERAQESTNDTGKVTIDADGTIHLPAMTVPPSSFASEEARKNFMDFARGFASLNEQTNEDVRSDDIIADRKRLDDLLMRPGLEKLRAAFPVTIHPEMIGGVQTDVVEPARGVAKNNISRVLINLHGGGFMVGARLGGQMESVPIASLGAIKVVTVDYREAPEHRFPAASEDVAAVYQELLKTYRANRIGIYGCSAGGTLTAQSVAWFQAHRLPRPGAIGIFGAGGTVIGGGDSDYLGQAIGGWGMSYPVPVPNATEKVNPYLDVPGLSLQDPLVSPAHHPSVLALFPPSLLISGTRDAALSSTIHTHAQLVKAGVRADLHVWEGTPHCSFAQPVVDPNEPESREAWSVIVKFFAANLGR